MKRASKLALATIGLLVVVIAAAAIAFFVLRARLPSPPPPELVPPAWAVFRTSAGHRAHVGKPGIECKSCHDFERDGFKNPGSAPCVGCHTH